MIHLEGLNPLPEIGGVSMDVDHIANAQCAELETQRRDRQVTIIVGDDADTLPQRIGLGRQLGIGVAATGCAGRPPASVRPSRWAWLRLLRTIMPFTCRPQCVASGTGQYVRHEPALTSCPFFLRPFHDSK